MIIKIKSHKRTVFGNILKYMMDNKDRLFDENKRSFAISHNLKGNNLDAWIQQFKANELCRLRNRSDSVRLTHEILSWHVDDAKNMTLAKMEAMARKYIEQRNPNGIYVAVPHFDKNHYHVHICASGIEYKTGKSLRLSKADLQKLKVETQNFQIENFPELSNSIVKHGKKDKSVMTDKEYHVKRRTGRETQREHLSGILKTCYKKADSRESFFLLLKESGLKTYERSGKITGVIDNNLKFRFSRLGYTEDRFEYLDKGNIRKEELKDMRTKEVVSPGREIEEPNKSEEEPELEEEINNKETLENSDNEDTLEDDEESEISRDTELDEIRNENEDYRRIDEIDFDDE